MSAHCTDEACSVCRAADVKRVEIRDGWVYVDGVRIRRNDGTTDGHREQNSRRRGGRR